MAYELTFQVHASRRRVDHLIVTVKGYVGRSAGYWRHWLGNWIFRRFTGR